MIHHHCGDHEFCEVGDCEYRQIENHYVCKHRVEKDDAKSREEILAANEHKINEDYAKRSRFSGMAMSMGKKGRAKLQSEVTKRLDEKNIDRVARCMSSNRCENYFSVLVKYTCGKRIYFGRKKGWKVRLLFTAASLSNNRVNDDVREHIGIGTSSIVREQQIEAALKEKQYQAEYKKTEKYKARRKAKKLVKCKQVVSNARNPARHKTGKLSPKENVKSATGKPATKNSAPKKRKTPCPNCKQFHPGKCPEPDYSGKRSVKSKIDKGELATLF